MSTGQQSNLRCVAAHFSQTTTILKSGDTCLTLN